MPDKPCWSGKLQEISERLSSLPEPWIDCGTLEQILGVSRRRAQQILAPCVTRRIGRNGLSSRDSVLERLRSLVDGDTGHFERRRRIRLARMLDELRQERMDRPRLLVEAPASVTTQSLDALPADISLGRGEICIRFSSSTEALEKLLALAMAIGNDREYFERITSGLPSSPPS